MQKAAPKRKIRPSQVVRSSQGKEARMKPEPVYEKEKTYQRLAGKVAIITGGDSGIGRAVAIGFVKGGAEVCIAYRNDHRDAKETANRIEELGGKCLLLPGDVSDENHCRKIVRTVLATWKRIDIIVNNAAVQFPQKKLDKITSRQLRRTFEVNVFSQLYLTKAAEKYLRKGAAIINTTSVTAYRGSSHLIDYASTKGAIVSMIRSLAAYFSEKGIRVNGVAPGPVWTPLIPTTFSPKEVATFGSDTPLKRAADPVEIAYAYVFLASDEASYITGQVLHPNGGEIVNTKSCSHFVITVCTSFLPHTSYLVPRTLYLIPCNG